MQQHLEGILIPLFPTMKALVTETIQMTVNTPDAILWHDAVHIGQTMLQKMQQKPGWLLWCTAEQYLISV